MKRYALTLLSLVIANYYYGQIPSSGIGDKEYLENYKIKKDKKTGLHKGFNKYDKNDECIVFYSDTTIRKIVFYNNTGEMKIIEYKNDSVKKIIKVNSNSEILNRQYFSDSLIFERKW